VERRVTWSRRERSAVEGHSVVIEAHADGRADVDEIDDVIEAELAVGEREACSAGFGFSSDVRLAMAATQPIPKVRR
jgi:hypothetical protein